MANPPRDDPPTILIKSLLVPVMRTTIPMPKAAGTAAQPTNQTAAQPVKGGGAVSVSQGSKNNA